MRNPKTMLPFEDLEQGLTPEASGAFQEHVGAILRAPHLIYDQKKTALAAAAMRALPYPRISDEAKQAIVDGTICLLSEGAAPYHPRYVAPDYEKLLRQGSEFLELKPARDLHDATSILLTAYHNIPSALPVFIGRLDALLEPFLDTVGPDEARATLRSFWLLVDRLFPDAFVHANIGPSDSRTGRLLLDLDRELKTICNVTLRYDPEVTDRSFAVDAVRTSLQLSKPYFSSHPMMVDDWGPDYAIASCYNVMRLGGGIYTLVRLNLKKLMDWSDGSVDDVLDRVIPKAARLQMEIINSRIRFLVEEVGYFDTCFFVREGLLHPDRFTAYAGMFGLAEAVNHLMAEKGRPEARYGHDAEANSLGRQIMERLDAEIAQIPALYCEGYGGRASFHAQVGIQSDQGVTPGARVPSGEEPPLYEHLQVEAPHHRLLEGGVSTILEFDQTAESNPEAVLDIVNGAMHSGIRTLSVGSTTSEYIRVSGYLMRRSDLEAAAAEKTLRHESTPLAVEFFEMQPEHLHRRVRKV
jgi:YjjI family glycine radical enzyme